MEKQKSSKFIGVAVAGFLTLSMATQIGTTYYETVQAEKQFNRLEARITQSVAQTKAHTQAMKAAMVKQMNTSDVTEEFVITEELEGGYVRGELAEGTGEGIYYHQDFFADFVGKVKIGDKVSVTWTKTAYDNEDWENVKTIGKIY